LAVFRSNPAGSLPNYTSNTGDLLDKFPVISLYSCQQTRSISAKYQQNTVENATCSPLGLLPQLQLAAAGHLLPSLGRPYMQIAL